MGQLYLQRFEYRGAIDKSAFDKAWAIANETMAKTGNWGGVKKGIKHIHAYGTAWGRPLWKTFFARAAQVVDIAWSVAALADLANDGVTGKKPPGFPIVNWYMGRVQNLASRDEDVCRAFFDVSNLLASPTTLFSPRIAIKVLSPSAGQRSDVAAL